MPHRLLYLVRHGAYDPDPADPVDGGSLNEAGRQQASLLADRLAGVKFDVIRHSTSPRAVQTADLLAFALADTPRQDEDLLRECIPSIPDDDVLTKKQRDFFAQLPDSVRHEGPVRAKDALERFTAVGEKDSRELIVSHGNLINYFTSRAMEAPEHGWLRLLDYHCAVTIIRYSSQAPARVISYNDAGHLPVKLRGIEYPAEMRV